MSASQLTGRATAGLGAPTAMPTSTPTAAVASVANRQGWVIMLNCVHVLCILYVLAIQLGQVLHKMQVRRAAHQRESIQLVSVSAQPLPIPEAVVETQPLALAFAMACSYVTRTFGPKRQVEVGFSNWTNKQVFEQLQRLDQLSADYSDIQREVKKTSARVVLCTEQLRTLRQMQEELSGMSNSAAIDHHQAIIELQEQAATLQSVLASLQDVVVKQMQVMTPPIKRLNERVQRLETGVVGLRKAMRGADGSPVLSARSG